MPYREFKLDDTHPFASIEDPPSAIVYYKRLSAEEEEGLNNK